MDALLPFEVARLVLGYLEENKCEEAAKIFKEQSPLLSECRRVSQQGKKYSKNVGGLSLIDILDKYCMANAMVQEKLKGLDCRQIKDCNDLIQQLKYLLGEGATGHRCVVNISVPLQNSPSGSYGSPNLSGSSRKRHRSSSERDCNTDCNTVEATPLAILSGHTISTRPNERQNRVHDPSKDRFTNKPIFAVNTSKNNLETNTSNNPDQNLFISNLSNVNRNCKHQWTETLQKTTCTTGTNTEPSDCLESESEFHLTNEPVQNLSICTTEFLQETELHERVAENINKEILPVKLSFREEHTYENTAETNVPVLPDFRNTFTTDVQSNPDFIKILKDLYEDTKTHTSLDEDSNQILINQNHLQTNEPMHIVELDNNLTGNAARSQEFNELAPSKRAARALNIFYVRLRCF